MAERIDPAGPPPTPPGLRDEWPVEWQPVWGPADGVRRRAEALLLRGVLGMAGRLPEPLLRGLTGTLARIGKRFDRRRTGAARRFLLQALGELPERELERRVLDAYRHFFRVIVDSDRLLRRVPPERILERFDVRWTDGARRVLADGGGCVGIAAHVGYWEGASTVLPWLGFDPLYAVAKPTKNRPLSIAIQRMREERGLRLLPRRGAMNDAPKIIAAGGTIGLLLDQRARKRPVLAPFFGRPARCDRSVGVLLRRLKVPVLPMACYMTDEPLRYRLEFFDVLWPDELAGADPVQIATRVNGLLEEMIRRHPEQYFWLHDRFRDTPDAFPTEEEREIELRPPGRLSSNAPVGEDDAETS